MALQKEQGWKLCPELTRAWDQVEITFLTSELECQHLQTFLSKRFQDTGDNLLCSYVFITMIPRIIWLPRQFQCNSWPDVHLGNRGYSSPCCPQELRIWASITSQIRQWILPTWIPPQFSSNSVLNSHHLFPHLVSSLKYAARVSSSRADSFFSSGWYQICYYLLAWPVNIDRITAWSWPGRTTSLQGGWKADSFLPNETTNASVWYLGSMQNIHDPLLMTEARKKYTLQPLRSRSGRSHVLTKDCHDSQPASAVIPTGSAR